MRRVKAFWWQGKKKIGIGELAQARTGSEIVFEWDSSFFLSNIELSPIKFKKIRGLIKCPTEPFEGLPGLFADHVPDGWGRILLRHGFLAKGLSFSDASPLDMLCYIGERGMGALSFEPALRPAENWANSEVDLDSLNAAIEPILAGTPSSVIEEFLAGGASPNGSRPKIILKEDSGRWFVGKDELVSEEWLVKFRAPGDSPDIGKVEFAYSKLAQKAGLIIPETRLFTTNRDSYFGVKRFDRVAGNRLHVHTLSGILQTSPSNFSVSYENFAQVTNFLTQDIREFEQVFRIASFNIFACNRDDHAKNVAFIMDEKGSWRVAPAYDLTFFENRRYPEHKMTLNEKGLPKEPDLIAFGRKFGLRAERTKELVDQVRDAVSSFPELAKELDISPNERKLISKALNETLAPTKTKRQ